MIHSPFASKILLIPLLVVVGCTTEAENPFVVDSADDGLPSAEGDLDGETAASEGSDADEGAIKLDVGATGSGTQTGGDDPNDDACHKIDFLFVVDNSGSMSDEQANLVASFAGFVDTIENATMTDDFRVMVVDTDDYRAPGEGGYYQCNQEPGCCDMACAIYPYAICDGTPCSPTPPPPPVTCEDTLGAGKAENQYGFSCGLEPGRRYLDSSDDLSGLFSCIAQVGINGEGDERPMEAMMQAIGVETLPGGCNDGFVRDDAVLVVTVITDEEDDMESELDTCVEGALPPQGSSGDPAAWKSAVLDAKFGIEENVVVLGLIGPPSGNTCPPIDACSGGLVGAEAAPRLAQFIESFSQNMVGRVCDPSYEAFFADAVGLVTEACEGFTPPG